MPPAYFTIPPGGGPRGRGWRVQHPFINSGLYVHTHTRREKERGGTSMFLIVDNRLRLFPPTRLWRPSQHPCSANVSNVCVVPVLGHISESFQLEEHPREPQARRSLPLYDLHIHIFFPAISNAQSIAPCEHICEHSL